MSFFRKLRKLIPIFTFKDTDSCPYLTIVSNVAEPPYYGISPEDFFKHIMGKNPLKIPITMSSLIPISKEDRDMRQQFDGIVEWLTYKPTVSDDSFTPLDIITDINTSKYTNRCKASNIIAIVDGDEISDTKNDKCFSQSSKQTLNTSGCSENLSADDVVYIGIYTRVERREKIKRYRSKKRKDSREIMYEERSNRAKKRQRNFGRFR